MEDRKDSDQFLPLQQSPVYAEALSRLGARTRWIETLVGPVLAVERGRLRVILRGPVFTPQLPLPTRRRALRDLAQWPGLTIATPEQELRGFGLVPLVTPMHHAVWELGSDLRRGMARNWRNHLAQAERSGLRPSQGDRATLERLIVAEAAQRRLRGYRALPGSFARALPEGALRLWEWREGGEMQAAMVFIRHGRTASYHLAWGSARARSVSMHHLMLTRAAEALAREGVGWLDLGSLDSDRAPGLAQFKLGTGAGLRRLGATLLVLP